MTQQGDAVAGELATEKVGIKGYLAFFLTIIFFSGVFSGDVLCEFLRRVFRHEFCHEFPR
mgnify:FL=1